MSFKEEWNWFCKEKRDYLPLGRAGVGNGLGFGIPDGWGVGALVDPGRGALVVGALVNSATLGLKTHSGFWQHGLAGSFVR